MVVSTTRPSMIQSSESLATTRLSFLKLVVVQILDLAHHFQTILTLIVILLHVRQLVRSLILCWIQSIGILPRHYKIMTSNLPSRPLSRQKIIKPLTRIEIRSTLTIQSSRTIFQMVLLI